MKHNFLPICREDMRARGWEQLDFLFVSGDAYVDHPSFGHAIITRLLEREGFRVGILPQPEWRSVDDFRKMGKPKIATLISAGNLDSMLNKLTASKKIRSTDVYSPGAEPGHRPDRATIVYSSRIKECWPDLPVIIGGIEASLRRFAHYDYWSDKVRRSVLVDSKADLLIYGMGENQILEIAARLKSGETVKQLRDINGTCFASTAIDVPDGILLPSYDEVSTDKKAYAEAFRHQYLEQDPIRGHTLIQPHGAIYLVQNPPAAPLKTSEIDRIYSLPYERRPHPSYDSLGGVPAIEEVKFSLVSHRGCFGSCSFCAIGAHQGRIIQQRSHKSLLAEARILSQLPDFKGYIHDVGGPTANFRHPSCKMQLTEGTCRDKQCLFPQPCKNLDTDHSNYLGLLRELRSLPGIKKVFIRSGIRYDYILAGDNDLFLRELCEHHVSGQLKVAPEHCSSRVIAVMQKSGKNAFLQFKKRFEEINQQIGKKQYLVPYFMCGHPGCTIDDSIELAEFCRDIHYHPEQVQEFIPTPGSLSSAIFYTGIHPLTGKEVYVPRSQRERRLQRALLQYTRFENYQLVEAALCQAGKQRELIGFGQNCLLRPLKRSPVIVRRQPPGRNKKRN